MPSRNVGIFFEDFAQEQYIKSLAMRLLWEHGVKCVFKPYVKGGGRPAVLGQLKLFFRLQRDSDDVPDFIIVGNDGNCQGHVQRRNEVMNCIPEDWKNRVVAAIPDPHVEAWFFRDLAAFHRAVGPCDAPPAHKCDKDFYKAFLRQSTIRAVGYSPLGGIENAEAIVTEQDIERLKSSGRDLHNFIDSISRFV